MNDSININPGDVVQLKSGGAPMTVAQTDNKDSAECFWSNEVGNIESIWLLMAVLKKY